MKVDNQIFGLASVASYIRCLKAGYDGQLVLQALSYTFNNNSGNGIYLYNLFNADTGLATTKGFSNSDLNYMNLENAVGNYESNSLSKVGISAIIYSYATYPNIDESTIDSYINLYNTTIKSFQGAPNYVDINNSNIDSVLSSFSLSAINSTILSSSATANSNQTNVNYNWYDSSILFDFSQNIARSNLIRDVENQYYYLSGELLYSNAATVFPPCIKTIVNINGSTGSFPITILKNYPCADQSSYVGPKTGVKFLRVFNDGPTTSGYFDSSTTETYINFDKQVLSPFDYSSNSYNLYSYISDTGNNYLYLYSGAQLDIQGYYNSGAEYGYGHTNYMVAGPRCPFNYTSDNLPLMNMHQGNNSGKLYITKYDTTPNNASPTCVINVQTGDWTGWKFALLELKDFWTGSFTDIQTNPATTTSRYLKRALNLYNENIDGAPVSPYSYVVDTGDGSLTCPTVDNNGQYLYVGPPQLNGIALLPGFAFYQDFYNYNFPSSGKIFIRPAISDELNNYQISNFNIFSGIDTNSYNINSTSKPHIPFNVVISSTGLNSYDDIFKKCLSIGDNFKNQVTSTTGLQANAGFIYTGYTYSVNGSPVSLSQVLNLSSSKIGATYSKVNYVTGYNLLKISYPSGIETFTITGTKSINNLFAHIITGYTSSGINYTGQKIIYQYFNTGVLGATNSQWNYPDDLNNYNSVFAPVPPDVQKDPSSFQELYASQAVENYNPRYYSGPYVSYNSQFLYQNAQACGNIYNFNHQGFPYKVKYSISVKEETVREAFYLSGVNYVTENIQIIRAGSGNKLQNLGTQMAVPFIANNPYYTNVYDFTKNKTLYSDNSEFFYIASLGGVDLVDANYIPNTNYCNQLNLNNTVYNSHSTRSFVNGIKYTGQLTKRNIYTGNGLYKTILNTEPFSDSLYWGYKNTVMTGEFLYCPPVFDLGTCSISPSANLTGAMYDPIASVIGSANSTFSNNGSIRYGDLVNDFGNYNGKDPLFYQYVGGRSGLNANLDGGTNSKGIIGDSWYGFNIGSNPNGGKDANYINYPYYAGWGQTVSHCGFAAYYHRDPKKDAHLFLNSLTSTGLNIYARGLYYNPYYYSGNYKPFISSSISFSGLSGTVPLKINNEYYFKYDLKNNFYPLKTGDQNSTYLSGGLVIGPFDRDVELCVMSGNSIYPSGSLVIDGEVLAVGGVGYSTCPANYTEGFYINSGITTDIRAARNVNLTTFKLIPSGSTSNINISGIGKIGLLNSSIMTIRPRTILGAVNYTNLYNSNPNAITGDVSIMDNFNYIDNGTEKVFSFPSANFNSLQGKTFSSQTTQRVQILFPKPTDLVDFDNVLQPSIDSLGNKTYRSNPTQAYWSKKNPNSLFTGVREISRLYISIDQITPEFGQIPYQNYKILIPSGECTVSGIFAYSGQAESAIVSQGVVLSGKTIARALSGIFNPIYISDILSMIPTGIQTFPSGNAISPILPAPSYMKQRKNYLQITGNDTYISTPGSLDLNYNKFLWPALSDLAILNPEIVYEALPPEDGSVFLDSYLTFSASQGQNIGTGLNLNENVTYISNPGYFVLSSSATNPIYNTAKCISSLTPVTINSGNLTGILAQQNSSLTMNLNFNTGQQI